MNGQELSRHWTWMMVLGRGSSPVCIGSANLSKDAILGALLFNALTMDTFSSIDLLKYSKLIPPLRSSAAKEDPKSLLSLVSLSLPHTHSSLLSSGPFEVGENVWTLNGSAKLALVKPFWADTSAGEWDV